MKSILSLSFALLSFSASLVRSIPSPESDAAPRGFNPTAAEINANQDEPAEPFVKRTTHAPKRKRQLAQVITQCTRPNTVALTFDDGPWWYMYDISGKLLERGAKGTFFVNGQNYECIYDNNGERIKYLYGAGHQIASHTWSHANLATLSWDQVHHEMWLVEQALQRLIGVTPAFMRPPYGAYNDMVRSASAIRGQSIVLWDFDSGDSNGASAGQSKQAYTDRANARPDTILALNHETSWSTAFDVLPHAIDVLQAKGYQLVTLAECLDMPAYQSVGAPQQGSWTC